MKYGYIPSKLDGSEHTFELNASLDIPQLYDYKKQLGSVLDLGTKPTCVCCSISAALNFICKSVGKEIVLDRKDSERLFEECGGDYNEGMEIKKALHYLRHNGFATDGQTIQINEYAKVGSINNLKMAIISNGVCIGALKVYSDNPLFWRGSSFQGGHAIAIVGYNKEGFVLRNSWGEYWGDNGYTTIPYDDFDLFLELWTII